MNPSDTKGPGFGQPANGTAGLPSVQDGQLSGMPMSPPASAGAGGQSGVLEVTLEQLTKLMRQYAQDPYMQAKEIERLKAAYLSKEFGRVLKAADN